MKKRKRALQVTLCALAVCVNAFFASMQPAYSAIIRIVDRQPHDRDDLRCHARLDGPIEAGDAQKLLLILQDLDREFTRKLDDKSNAILVTLGNIILCLNSPGGSYADAINISEYLLHDEGSDQAPRWSVTTFVGDGSTCLSACALIFMAGKRVSRYYDTRVPSRVLHVRGVLGFHAPYIDSMSLDNRTYTKAEIVATFEFAVRSIRTAIKVFDYSIKEGLSVLKPEPWVRPSLFVEMLSRGPSELLLIDTVGKAGRWRIELVGFRDADVLDENTARAVCENEVSWLRDADRSDTRLVPIDKNDPLLPPDIKPSANVLVFAISYVREVRDYCVVRYYTQPANKREFLLDFNGYSMQIPVWRSEPAETLIRELSVATARTKGGKKNIQ